MAVDSRLDACRVWTGSAVSGYGYFLSFLCAVGTGCISRFLSQLRLPIPPGSQRVQDTEKAKFFDRHE